VTSRLETVKSVTFFYSVPLPHPPSSKSLAFGQNYWKKREHGG
jgi:hypothetical protein